MARARGTFYFMAPEMFWGYATPASDVYMLGFIMYWLYAGLPPYPVPTLPEGASAQDFADAIQRSRDTPAPPLTRFRLDIPAAMTELIAKALSPDPNQRFPNAMMFSAALRGV
jgi:serine/threonine-protein kinase